MEQRDGMTQEFIDHQSENPQKEKKRSRTATEKGEFLRLQRLEDERKVAGAAPVSYTHLTLPTIYSV